MAKIIASFDTLDKTLTVTVDGKAVADVMDVSMYRKPSYEDDGDADDGDKFSCAVVTVTENQASGIRQYVRMCASETTEAKQAQERGVASLDAPAGMTVTSSRSPVEDDVAGYFGRG